MPSAIRVLTRFVDLDDVTPPSADQVIRWNAVTGKAEGSAAKVDAGGSLFLPASQKIDFGAANITVEHAPGVLAVLGGKFGIGGSPAEALHVLGNPPAGATRSLVRLGTAAVAQANALYGAYLGINQPSTIAADFLAFELDSINRFRITSAGTLVLNSGSDAALKLNPNSGAIAFELQNGGVQQGYFFSDTASNAIFLQANNGANNALFLSTTGVGPIHFRPNNAIALSIVNGGNIGIGTQNQFGGGAGVIGIANAGMLPTTNPTGAHVLYAEGGALKGRGSSGTITTIAPAEPECPVCGRDFVVEWESERHGHLAVCMWCLTDGAAAGVISKRPDVPIRFRGRLFIH